LAQLRRFIRTVKKILGEVKLTILTLATATLAAASPAAFAQGVSSETPGHRMQSETQTQKRSHPNSAGASYYAPGQKMQRDRAKGKDSPGPGASGYAPGRSTTGSGSKY
jgi:hypothetical protein